MPLLSHVALPGLTNNHKALVMPGNRCFRAELTRAKGLEGRNDDVDVEAPPSAAAAAAC